MGDGREIDTDDARCPLRLHPKTGVCRLSSLNPCWDRGMGTSQTSRASEQLPCPQEAPLTGKDRPSRLAKCDKVMCAPAIEYLYFHTLLKVLLAVACAVVSRP